MVAFETAVTRLRRHEGRWQATVADEEMPFDAVINAAAARRAGACTGDGGVRRKADSPPLVYAKGNYFGCTGRPAFSRLIYPAPVDGGLRRACDPRSRRADCASARMWNGSRAKITRWIRSARRVSMPQSGATGPPCRWRPDGGLFRHPPQTHRPREPAGGFHDLRAAGAWSAGPCRPVRHREPRADLLPVDRGCRGGGSRRKNRAAA